MSSYKFQPPAPIPSKKLVSDGADYIWPNGPSRCTWQPGADTSTAPHLWQDHHARPDILPDILHHIGNTPLVRLNNITKSLGITCEILAKCEFFNPGGSVKDRIAYRMVEDAEKRGLLKKGDTIIEPTSGNTGIGLALAAAVKGYRCIIVMPMKMSSEKVDTLKALGAEVVRTPTAASFDSPEGLIAVAQKMSREIPNSIIMDQYRNAFNPIAHYEHTAQEILDQCGGKIDAVVLGAGTGGTVAGIGRKMKNALHGCKVIAADPYGSSLSLPEELNKTDVSFYEVEGIGYDFIPTVLDRSVVDKWVKVGDKEALSMARRLIREEGLLCGGSSGTAMVAAVEVAKSMGEGQRLVVLLPDGMRNYMTKFVSDTWMQIRHLAPLSYPNSWWSDIPISNLNLSKPEILPVEDITAKVATEALQQHSQQVIFVEKQGIIQGFVSKKTLLSSIVSGKITMESQVESILAPVRTVSKNVPLGYLAVVLEKEEVILIADEDNSDFHKWARNKKLVTNLPSNFKVNNLGTSPRPCAGKSPGALVTINDVLSFIAKGENILDGGAAPGSFASMKI